MEIVGRLNNSHHQDFIAPMIIDMAGSYYNIEVVEIIFILKTPIWSDFKAENAVSELDCEAVQIPDIREHSHLCVWHKKPRLVGVIRTVPLQ